jgi:nucleoside-diphosphate-sugar epimerase
MASDLPIVESSGEEPEDPNELAPREVPTVLLTGACGNVGRRLRQGWGDRYDLILIDRDPGNDPDVFRADLAKWDADWLDLMDEVDVVVHLAANADPGSSWEALVGPNLDALANVMIAAASAGVERLILASSTHVLGGPYTTQPAPFRESAPPAPESAYGASKLFAERLGRSIATCYGITVIALRLGWITTGENRPEDLPDDRGRAMWLSDRDLCQLITRAIEAELEPGRFVVCHGTSANRGSPWLIDTAREVLGYEPVDNAFAGMNAHSEDGFGEPPPG